MRVSGLVQSSKEHTQSFVSNLMVKNIRGLVANLGSREYF